MGAAPALAGYFHIAYVTDNDNRLADVQAVIDNYESTTTPNMLADLCTTLVSSVKIEFSGADSVILIGPTDIPYTQDGITIESGTFNADDEMLTGEWSSTFTVNFFTVKAGDGYELWAWDGLPTGMEGNWTTGTTFLEGHGTSHLSFFTTDCSEVPIPGALWLLGSGLGALMVGRRRKRKA